MNDNWLLIYYELKVTNLSIFCVLYLQREEIFHHFLLLALQIPENTTP